MGDDNCSFVFVPLDPKAFSQIFFRSLCAAESRVLISEDLDGCLDVCEYHGGLDVCAWAP